MNCFRILLLEDDESDAFLITRGLRAADPSCEIFHSPNPVDAISRIENIPDAAELPDLIISDLKMAEMNGLEFVAWLRQSPFRCIPVVMLSSSMLPEDVRAAYEAGANSWITKPNSYERMQTKFRTLIQYWRDVARARVDYVVEIA